MADPVNRPTSAPDMTPGWTSWFNWVHELVAACRQAGVTADRPTSGLWIGRMYYDRTLGYPVWVHAVSPAIVWHNGAGAAV